jgi:hypothetical protein
MVSVRTQKAGAAHFGDQQQRLYKNMTNSSLNDCTQAQEKTNHHSKLKFGFPHTW